MSIDQVEQAAMELSVEEREQLAVRLMASLPPDPEIAEAWYDEAERRRAQLESGEARTIPLEEVWASLGLDPGPDR